jgi:hypothetical protein
LVVISIPSLVECPFKSFAHLKIVFAYYCCWVVFFKYTGDKPLLIKYVNWKYFPTL